ncbi:unnamed protein product [Meganyctiphanes norvegica]|uniref:Kazal-like domain-containing protein n=1 Tax=Meganyctiphanes norvegica TaxID=48144 RepID=A0AAV2SD68_MEGNR
MVRFCVSAFVIFLSLCALSAAAPSLSKPTSECQRWCPRPGPDGDQCCDDDFLWSCFLSSGLLCTRIVICGSDGIVYPNSCAFDEAQCRNPALQRGDSCSFDNSGK